MGEIVEFRARKPAKSARQIETFEQIAARTGVPQHHLENAARIPSHLIGHGIEFGPDGTTTVNGGVREFKPYTRA